MQLLHITPSAQEEEPCKLLYPHLHEASFHFIPISKLQSPWLLHQTPHCDVGGGVLQ